MIAPGFLRIVTVCMSIFAWFSVSEVKAAGPFVDFFRAVRHSITHPEEKPRAHRKSHKQNNRASSPEVSSQRKSGSVVSAPPNGENVRVGKAATSTKKEKNDLRYGTPVPGRQGFVTSPFAPESGYIDVRGFAPGTAVKDPYTGKVFLNP